MQLSRKVTFQRRVVYSVLGMLGEVGGLTGLFITVISWAFGLFTPHFFLVSRVKALFRVSSADKGAEQEPAK